MSDGSTTWTFTYDADGMRTKKTNGTDTYTYVYNGGLLSQMTKGTDTLRFSYDASGLPLTVTYNGTTYYYITNIQGDVIGITNQSGQLVVQYLYNAWGVHLETTGTMAATLGTLNPLRYRGYVYDAETELYYLQSRYYDPELCRFINADGFVSTGQGLLGNNMFAYCGNNPVNRIDASGNWWEKVGKFFEDGWNAVKEWAKKTFGAGATSSKNIYTSETQIIPEPSPITITTGKDVTQTVNDYGDSTKPLSVYADGDLDSPGTSSAGAKINVGNFSIDISLGLDNTGIMGSLTEGQTTRSFGLRLDLSRLRVGLEASSSFSWDQTTYTDYSNVNVSLWFVAFLYLLATTGQTTRSYVPQGAQ